MLQDEAEAANAMIKTATKTLYKTFIIEVVLSLNLGRKGINIYLTNLIDRFLLFKVAACQNFQILRSNYGELSVLLKLDNC